MEAHTGAITFPREWSRSRRRSRLAEIRALIRRRQMARAERAYSMRVSGPDTHSIPGSEHSHLVRRPRGF